MTVDQAACQTDCMLEILMSNQNPFERLTMLYVRPTQGLYTVLFAHYSVNSGYEI